ncbi:ATP-dependent DNA helicase RecG [Eubacteriaceae bacterium ES3]|nr:ATP-dependent DNA helicase RecG [Eubacteriaceae bacterium ES3]
MDYNQSVKTIKGVGGKREKILNENGIYIVKDLLNLVPLKYINRNFFLTAEGLAENDKGTIKAAIEKISANQFMKNHRSFFTLKVLWEEKTVNIRIFNQPYLRNSFILGATYYFFGHLKRENNQYQMINPQFVRVNNPGSFFEFEPVYPTINGISSKNIRKMMKEIFSHEIWIPADIPKSIRSEYQLCNKAEAFRKLHIPEKMEDVEIGIRRFKFDEALKINMGILQSRNQDSVSDVELSYFKGLEIFVESLPFELTHSQKVIIQEITDEIVKRTSVNRLIQGDVGSGKTVIAVAISCLLAQNGYQIAYMAPTEILARQHYETFSKLLKNFDITIDILTGSLKDKQKKTIYEGLKNGEISIIIGTHALIQNEVEYYNLGLIITDEQHRFGVRQKGQLFLKGKNPHTLVMSATPIPRTLSLILYGDLMVSVVSERPKGRKPVKTHCYNEKKLPDIYEFVKNEVKKGNQAYIICPFVEFSENMENVRDIGSVFDELKVEFEPEIICAYLHGKMTADEKNDTITQFSNGSINVLVATSIIEVGIDVMNANTIVILNAERFGLAQLHQLRGRVGRGSNQAWCFLVTNITNSETIERMRIIVNNHEGIDIAEADLKLRGPGDYFGYKQHGLPEMRFLDPLGDLSIIESTREIAKQMIDSNEKEMMICADSVLHSFYESVNEIALN